MNVLKGLINVHTTARTLWEATRAVAELAIGCPAMGALAMVSQHMHALTALNSLLLKVLVIPIIIAMTILIIT